MIAWHHGFSHLPFEGLPDSCGSLLEVNKQINTEAKELFYSLSTFIVSTVWA